MDDKTRFIYGIGPPDHNGCWPWTGTTIHTSKLVPFTALLIRVLHNKRGLPQNMLARVFGVSTSTVHKLVRRQTWRHV